VKRVRRRSWKRSQVQGARAYDFTGPLMQINMLKAKPV
jgi:hypothetical protein